MPGEGEGEGGGGGGGGSAPGGVGGDISAILAYLNHQGFGADGDYTGNAGFGGDNTGPVGSEAHRQLSDALAGTLLAPADALGTRYGTGPAPAGTLEAGAGSTLAPYAGAVVNTYSDRMGPVRPAGPFAARLDRDVLGDARRMPTWEGSAPFAALRRTSLLASPALLAENTVSACDPVRASCLPVLRSDASESSVATTVQAEMDESFVAITQLMEGRARIAGNGEVDAQKLASHAAAVARSDEHQLGYQVNQLRDHPIEIRHSAALTGVGHMAWGLGTMTVSGLVVYGSGGLALPLLGATGFAAGTGEVLSGFALAISGADSVQTLRMSGQLDYVFALSSSPGSLVFGTTGLVLSGDVDVSHRFALVGGVAEGMAGFRGNPSRLYSSVLPGVETTAEKAASSLLVKDVAALGYTARGESVSAAASKLNREFTVDDLRAIDAFREEMVRSARLDRAGRAGHDAAGAAERGVDFSKFGGAFQQELKLHGPYTPLDSRLIDKAWNQSFVYSIKHQLDTRALGEQLVPIRSTKHIWVSPTEAVRSVR